MKLIKTKILFCSIILVSVCQTGTALAFEIGERAVFNQDANCDYARRTQVPATLRQVGDKALYYVDDEWWNSLGNTDLANTTILSLLAEFDRVIYPRLTQVYGSEWSPGIDGNLRLTILITHLNDDTGAYFNSQDEYPKVQLAASNEREMIYLNATYLTSSRMKSFLAHEFQHMINFYQKEKLQGLVEDIWLNEARSEYAPTICGYDNQYQGSHLEKRVNEFLRNPTDPLTEWQNKSSDYGPASIFMQYLASRYGEAILSKMIKADAVGIVSINKALAELGSPDRFADVFTNWTMASFANDCQLGEGQKFCYLTPNLSYSRLHLSSNITNLMTVQNGNSFSFADDFKDWSGHWYEISPVGSGLNLLLSFSGSSATNLQVPILIINNDGSKLVRYVKFDSNQQGSEMILNFGNQVKSVILIPSNQTEQTGFSANGPTYSFSYVAKITSATQLLTPTPAASPAVSSPVAPTPKPSSNTSPNYPDGTLIRAQGDYKVYVVSGQYRRWLQSAEIFKAYPHFGWQAVKEVIMAQRDWYQEAWLIRADGDARVFEINGDGTKHWLNMSAEQFGASGRQWDMIYIVNNIERDWYRTGADVLK